MRVGIVGATGYAGAEVLRICGQHPELEIVVATGESNAGKSVAEHVPALAGMFPTLIFAPTNAIFDFEVDAVFLALPHGQSQKVVPALLERGVQVIDLGADFRLKDSALYPQWYHDEHTVPELLERAVYGLVERHRSELVGATLIASPGCYPTASALAIGAFSDASIISKSQIVVNALSGVSGAGRGASERLGFSRLASNAEAYGLLTHRHTPEIQQELGVELLFTPHLVPVARGMLITAYARIDRSGFTTDDAIELLKETYANDPFIVVTTEPPSLKDPVGSNLCFVSARVDERTGWLVAMSSLDNLVKGAAGQAVQALNVSRGFDETLGLSLSGVTP